jgi:hypothetical protein
MYRNGAPLGQERGELPALDAADFCVVGAEGKKQSGGSFAQFREVHGFAI